MIYWVTPEIANLCLQAIIALAALFALQQIRIAKDTVVLNSNRESIKYATELIDKYLNEIIPIEDISDQALDAKGYKSYKGNLNLKTLSRDELLLSSQKIRDHYARACEIDNGDDDDFGRKLLWEQNAIEAFATPFIEKVADAQVAFNTIGLTFCDNIESKYFLYCRVRMGPKSHINFFPNTVALYSMWKDQLKLKEVQNKEKEIVEKHVSDQRKIAKEYASIEKKTIRPLGTEG